MSASALLFLIISITLASSSRAFLPEIAFPHTGGNFKPTITHDLIMMTKVQQPRSKGSPVFMSDDNEDEEDDEEDEPGEMRVSEIKAELKARGVRFGDCFDKESLVVRLKEARASGKANPEILDNFNKQQFEYNVKDEDIQKAVAGDGTLPGGMSPEMLQKLMQNPEVMQLLQSPKMQEAMKLMMSSGPEELEGAMKSDPELREIVQKLGEVMKQV